ncbi:MULTISPECIES: SCO family protein [unclassified Paracoccus (in: a-proteobacteria)]|uniref:SCO family protein n=1 Tax=unclassified Paracoccus (in: a-proteobacteria) TaxID=2688777 RepID=UPI0012B39EA8|nr:MULTISPECIES: SCO family protein [unclassified Paracoccus (in: a-proteobacteria)]UXU74862.1 SCO family protein [Paracoccus sp. SMMA_5]UXU80762.1 SCO family protein [Paracoccus sp. SMMA_5_TC]
MAQRKTGSSVGALRLALWLLVAAALAAVAWFQFVAPRLAAVHGNGGSVAAVGAASLGQGDYALTATDGSTFSQETLKGQPSAVFFGFTHCPDVCPTTLGDIATWREELGADADKLRVFFVTVDPERDDVETLREYLSWVPGVTGVTGSPEEMAKAIKAFRIYARKVPQEGGDYTMDHSSMMLLFDRDGAYAGLIGYQQDHDRTMASLRALVQG